MEELLENLFTYPLTEEVSSWIRKSGWATYRALRLAKLLLVFSQAFLVMCFIYYFSSDGKRSEHIIISGFRVALVGTGLALGLLLVSGLFSVPYAYLCLREQKIRLEGQFTPSLIYDILPLWVLNFGGFCFTLLIFLMEILVFLRLPMTSSSTAYSSFGWTIYLGYIAADILIFFGHMFDYGNHGDYLLYGFNAFATVGMLSFTKVPLSTEGFLWLLQPTLIMLILLFVLEIKRMRERQKFLSPGMRALQHSKTFVLFIAILALADSIYLSSSNSLDGQVNTVDSNDDQADSPNKLILCGLLAILFGFEIFRTIDDILTVGEGRELMYKLHAAASLPDPACLPGAPFPEGIAKLSYPYSTGRAELRMRRRVSSLVRWFKAALGRLRRSYLSHRSRNSGLRQDDLDQRSRLIFPTLQAN